MVTKGEKLVKFLKDETGASMVEEALILALICLGASAALTYLGQQVAEPFAKLSGYLKGITVIDKHPGGAL